MYSILNPSVCICMLPRTAIKFYECLQKHSVAVFDSFHTKEKYNNLFKEGL